MQPEPLDMRFPRKGLDKQITYVVLFPIIFPLWLTLPDTRGPRGKSWLQGLTFFTHFQGGASAEQNNEEEEEENAPLDLSWPDSCRERITYLLVLPIIIPLWMTLPDTRKASGIISSIRAGMAPYLVTV